MKILLVDDSKSARYALRLQLQQYGVKVDAADSAEAAFSKLGSTLPDVIFMDRLMSGLNGLEALERLRSEARTAEIPVVMCHSREDGGFCATAQARGAFAVLPKCDAEQRLPELMERLRNHLDGMPPTEDAEPLDSAPPPDRETVSAPQDQPSIDNARLFDENLARRLPPLFEELRCDLRRFVEIRVEHLAKRFQRAMPEQGGDKVPSNGEAEAPVDASAADAQLAALQARLQSLESANADLRESLELLRDCQHRAGRRSLWLVLLIFALVLVGNLLFG